MSLSDGAQKVAASVPTAFLVSWMAGVRWDMVAAFLACAWTLGLMWQAWLWKPFIKPWLEKRKASKK